MPLPLSIGPGSVCGCKISHACKCVRMLLSQEMLSFLHHHHFQCLCLLPLALLPVCACKICHASECVRVLLSQEMLAFLHHHHFQRLCLLPFALLLVDKCYI